MARIARRRVLTLSASGGMAAILASGRAPAIAQETERPLAALGRFRAGLRCSAQGPDHAGMQEGDRHHAQARDRQRQRPAVAHHLGDPVRAPAPTSSWRSNNWPQLYVGSLADVGDVAEETRQGPGRLLRRSPGRSATVEQQVDRRAVDDRRRADRLSQVLARGSRVHDLPRDLGHLPRGRQEAESQGAADRPAPPGTPSATRRAGGIPISGRGAARRSRPTERPSC